MAGQSDSSIDRPALAAALTTVVVWASAFVGIRDLAGTFSPGSVALGRLTVGVLALAYGVLRGRGALMRLATSRIALAAYG